jgi:hypothetical protein
VLWVGPRQTIARYAVGDAHLEIANTHHSPSAYRGAPRPHDSFLFWQSARTPSGHHDRCCSCDWRRRLAATNWVVGLTASSSEQGQSASISNLTIAAVATPTIGAGNTLYPSSVGDVVVKITNPNQFPVTVTGVNLPTATTYAPGYSDSLLSSAQTGCDSTLSFVSWTFASGTSGSVHTVSPIVVAGLGTSTVTLTGDASMGANSALACANTYFKMPALTGVVATSAPQGTVATTSPSVNDWTS